MSAAAPEAGAEPARRRGRRPAGEDTRAAILAAARSEFAARGYEGTTLRGVARAAGVDPRLVHHYFEGKDDLFTAAMELPFRPQDIVKQALEGVHDDDLGDVGERLLRTFLGVWDSAEGRERVVALLSSVLTSESAARTVREFLARELFGRLVAVIGGEDRELRASLAASQMIGLIMARYVVRIEPLASADPESFIPYLAPTLQRYLAGGTD
jgi:AcrR family transcriptional regulator